MNLIEKYKDVSYRNGKFLSDKSYAYDTIYFICKFINDYSIDGYFDLNRWQININHYISEIFNRNIEADDIGNYYAETFNVLMYANVIEKIGFKKYQILDFDTLNFICLKMENAYIFEYILAYYTLKNSNVLDLYKEFCFSNIEIEKIRKIEQINEQLYTLNPSLQSGPDSQWSMQNTKYIINILNFLNYQPQITRTFNLKKYIVRDPKTISVNINGSKTIGEKDNSYLENFDFSYVDEQLKDLIIYRGVVNNNEL